MAQLKLGAIEDDKPVRLTVELPASSIAILVAYGQPLGREQVRALSPPIKLIDPCCALHGDGWLLRGAGERRLSSWVPPQRFACDGMQATQGGVVRLAPPIGARIWSVERGRVATAETTRRRRPMPP